MDTVHVIPDGQPRTRQVLRLSQVPAGIIQRTCACGNILDADEKRSLQPEKKLAGFQAPLSVQPKLAISQPDDPYEREAERVADQVMRMPEPGIQMKSGCSRGKGPGCTDDDEIIQEGPVQRKATAQAGRTSDILPVVHEVLQSPGEPLDAGTRAFFEPRFGYDFSNVRVHTDTQAIGSARALNALAYTVGRDMVFNQNRYQPGRYDGQYLLAHELVHVSQQTGDLHKEHDNQTTDADKNPDVRFCGSADTCTGKNITITGGFLIQRAAPPPVDQKPVAEGCFTFSEGWTQRGTKEPGPKGRWCSSRELAQERAEACPKDCFLYDDGPEDYLWRPIPGWPCAHYVAHELNIRTGKRHEKCTKGFSVTIEQITTGSGKQPHPLTGAYENDIYIYPGNAHSGIVYEADREKGRVKVKGCGIGGGIYQESHWRNDGTVFR